MVHGQRVLTFDQIRKEATIDLHSVSAGDVVALIGDFDPKSIHTMLKLVDRKCILVPLTADTRPSHSYFFAAARVNAVIEGDRKEIVAPAKQQHPLLDKLREQGHSGLVLFSSG